MYGLYISQNGLFGKSRKLVYTNRKISNTLIERKYRTYSFRTLLEGAGKNGQSRTDRQGEKEVRRGVFRENSQQSIHVGRLFAWTSRRELQQIPYTILASVSPYTGPEPARRSVLAHSCRVVPVVKTSSTNKIRLPLIRAGLGTEKARRRFVSRSFLDNEVWGTVGRIRSKHARTRGIPRW